jgi:menaquinone-9 beta-reductase
VTPAGKRTDIFVIGGGPAGLAAAIAASRKGFSVTLADGSEPPVDKACGEGMMPGTLAALRELGVELPAGTGCSLRGIRFIHGDTEVAAEFPAGLGIGIRRTLLHSVLIRKAQECGVTLLWKTPVVGIESDKVLLNTGAVRAGCFVGADGTQSRVRRWSMLNSAIVYQHRHANRRHYRVNPWTEFTEVYWGSRTQAYVTPVSDEEVCVVTMGETAEKVDSGLALNAFPKLGVRLAGAALCGHERGAISATQTLSRVWRGNVALVGDASGGVDAITGEGLRLAFRHALALAESMHAGDLRAYTRAHRRLARRPLLMSKLMLHFGRYERLRSCVMSHLRRNPELFARLLAIHTAEAAAHEVLANRTQIASEHQANSWRRIQECNPKAH